MRPMAPNQVTRQQEVLSPSAIILPTLAVLACFLCVPPLVAHIIARNLAATVLVAGILIENIQNFINALIWPGYPLYNKWDGQGLCDVEVKLYIGIGVAISGATASIFRQLALILNTDKAFIIPSQKQKYTGLAFEIGLCLALPAYTMAVHYIVQPDRYYLIAVSGCVPSFYTSWVSYVLIFIWPVVVCLIGAGYCFLAIYRLIRYRRSVSSILSNSSTITKSRYFRLFGLASGLLLIYFPLAIFTLFDTATYAQQPFSWSNVHKPGWSQRIQRLDEATEKKRFYHPIDRWCGVATGFFLFLLFGLGQEATTMYKSWLGKLGFARWPSGMNGGKHSAFLKGNQARGPAELAKSHSSQVPIMDAVDLELARIDNDFDQSVSEVGGSPTGSSSNKSNTMSDKPYKA